MEGHGQSLKTIPHPKLHRLCSWALLITEHIPQQLQFCFLEVFCFE